jgi:tetratricopeptide (TPR) repeat protein
MALSVLLFTGAAFAQTSQIEGKVTGEDGAGLKDALIKIERKDIKGNYKVKTNKKGEYLHAGLPLGNYKVTLEVNGQDRDSVDNVRTRLGEPTRVDFDMKAQAQRQQAMQKAAESGQLTQEQAREMTPEQRAAIEKQMKERAAAMAKNKELNDAFNGGIEAMKTKNFDGAIEQFNKAGELDPKQHVIWGQLAEAYMGKANAASAPADRDAALAKSIESYQKAIEILPNDASYHNNFALALAKAKKFDEMQAEIEKAATIDPAGAGKYYFNLGAVLTNAGQIDPACQAFKKAITTDPNYADAHYQYGICLMSQGKPGPDGQPVYPEETAPSFQKYLELRPDGPNAEAAKGILDSMNVKIDTEYRAPGAAKPKPAKRK